MSLPSYLLRHSVTIERLEAGETVNDMGMPESTLETIATSVACLIQPNKEKVEVEKSGKKEIATHYGYFQFTQDILDDDLVTFNERKYRVMSVEDAAGQGHHKKVSLKTSEQ